MKTERNLVGFRSVICALVKNLIAYLSKSFTVFNHIFGNNNKKKV